MEVPYDWGPDPGHPVLAGQRPGRVAARAPRSPPPVPPPLLAKRHFRRPRLRARALSPECGTTCEHGDHRAKVRVREAETGGLPGPPAALLAGGASGRGLGGVCESSCKTPAAAIVPGFSGPPASLGGPYGIKWDTCPGFHETASPPCLSPAPHRFLQTREEEVGAVINPTSQTRRLRPRDVTGHTSCWAVASAEATRLSQQGRWLERCFLERHRGSHASSVHSQI
ncbi:unnamed protein product [Nyctereutes procyonoides]|uniref:(raccoon dog) hypothetical protein n=1 Tax=Nyctereutes procyonoides TaxID=34880 RepID=A0A811ZNM6_NYCPR|nr:unnamed protein product [Nyctereutes procyonoides]